MSNLPTDPPGPTMPPGPRSHVGGRYGSPTVTIALPFAKVRVTDGALTDRVAVLTDALRRLATVLAEHGDPAVAPVAAEVERLLAALD